MSEHFQRHIDDAAAEAHAVRYGKVEHRSVPLTGIGQGAPSAAAEDLPAALMAIVPKMINTADAGVLERAANEIKRRGNDYAVTMQDLRHAIQEVAEYRRRIKAARRILKGNAT